MAFLLQQELPFSDSSLLTQDWPYYVDQWLLHIPKTYPNMQNLQLQYYHAICPDEMPKIQVPQESNRVIQKSGRNKKNFKM